MTPLKDLPQVIRTLTARTRLVSLRDAASEMHHSSADCERVLDEYVARGVLRKTCTSRGGKVYYWLSEPKQGAQ